MRGSRKKFMDHKIQYSGVLIREGSDGFCVVAKCSSRDAYLPPMFIDEKRCNAEVMKRGRDMGGLLSAMHKNYLITATKTATSVYCFFLLRKRPRAPDIGAILYS